MTASGDAASRRSGRGAGWASSDQGQKASASRASARAHDKADLAAGRKIACPLLALWSAGSGLDRWYAEEGGPLALWREWADHVEGRALAGGHFFPEELPEETAAILRRFFGAGAT